MLKRTDKSRVLSSLDYLEKELPFLSEYEKRVDWKVYQTERSKRLEIERWVESLINATLDISKVLLVIRSEEVPETSREILFRVGSLVFDKEVRAEAFSELAKIRNTLAHRYLDMKWEDIKRFLQLVPDVYPDFIVFVKKETEK
jgi:uncharacterized protein YutE (UPF0331/DUF86 family)